MDDNVPILSVYRHTSDLLSTVHQKIVNWTRCAFAFNIGDTGRVLGEHDPSIKSNINSTLGLLFHSARYHTSVVA